LVPLALVALTAMLLGLRGSVTFRVRARLVMRLHGALASGLACTRDAARAHARQRPDRAVARRRRERASPPMRPPWQSSARQQASGGDVRRLYERRDGQPSSVAVLSHP